MSIVSKKALNLGESSTLKMARIASELKEKGLDIISLSLGEPDFMTPDFIKEAAKKAIDENYSKYSPVAGYKNLRDAICKKLKRDNDLDYTSDNIVVSTGAKQAIMNTILSLVNPGDEVIIPAPYWVSYIEMVRFAEGIPVVIETKIENDFKISKEDLKNAITSKTKLFIFSNPCNPTGSVYNRDELKELVSIFSLHQDMFIISDEIYELINFVGKNISLASFPEIKERVITVNGVSKGFSMTGWRLGYIAASKEIINACVKIQGQFTSGTSSVSQMAALAAVTEDPSVVTNMRQKFFERKELMVKLLSKIEGIKVNDPHGAFYIFPDISSSFGKKIEGELISDSDDFANLLLKHAQVAGTPGSAFGAPSNIRFSYATDEKSLTEACKRIASFMEKLS